MQDEKGERFACGVHERILVRWGLVKGKEITAAELDDIIRDDHVEKANKKALQLLAKRMRTEAELRRKLEDADVPVDHIDMAIGRMKHLGYINDDDYAEAYVRTTMSTTDKGPGSIRRYLYEKGVREAVITEALNQYDEQTQLNKILKIIEKKETRTPKDSVAMKKKKLTDALLRKGFQHSLITTAFEAYDFTQAQADERQALRLHAEKTERKLRTRYEPARVKQKLKERLYQKGFSLPMIDEYFEGRNEERE